MAEENPVYIYKTPSKNSFIESQVQKNFCDAKGILEINGISMRILKELHLSKDEKDSLVFISKITDSYLDLDGDNFVYKPVFTYSNGTRSIIPDDLSADELNLIDSLLDDITNPFLKARMADIIWYMKHGERENCIKRARQYINIFLGMELDSESFIKNRKEFRRAISIAKSIKYDYAKICEFKNRLISKISECEYNSPGVIGEILDIIEIAPELSDYESIHSAIEKKIHNAKETDRYWSTDIHYLELQQKCLKHLSKDIIPNLLKIAQRYELEAKSCDKSQEYLNAFSHYENAIKTYRSIPKNRRNEYAIDDKLAELASMKQKAGVASINAMKVISHEIKVPEKLMKDALNRVIDKKYPAVLFHYISILNGFPNIDEIKKFAEDEITNKKNLSDLFHKTTISSQGRITGKQEGIDISSPQAKEVSLNAKMIEIYFRCFSINIPLILQSLYTINNEHRISLDKILDACQYSAIIPRERILLWAKGLHAGFNQNFDVSMHILIPQLEHYVRVKMLNKDINTSVTDTATGVENEKSLSTLLENLESYGDKSVFTKEEFFELKALFGNFPSVNMRNIVAHGLLDDDSHLGESIYIWYFSLRLMLRNIPSC